MKHFRAHLGLKKTLTRFDTAKFIPSLRQPCINGGPKNQTNPRDVKKSNKSYKSNPSLSLLLGSKLNGYDGVLTGHAYGNIGGF